MLVRHLRKWNLSSVTQTNQAFKELNFYENNIKYNKKAVNLLKVCFSYAVDFIGELYNIQFNIVDPGAYAVLFQTHTTPGFLYSINVIFNRYSNSYDYLLKIAHAEFINKELDMNFINEYYGYPEDINDELVKINKVLKVNKKVSFYLSSKGSIDLDNLLFDKNIFSEENVKKASEFYDNFFRNKKEKQFIIDLFNKKLKEYCNDLIKNKNNYYSIAYKLNRSYKNHTSHIVIDIKTKPVLFNNKDKLRVATYEIKSYLKYLYENSGINNPLEICIDDSKYSSKYNIYLDCSQYNDCNFFDKVMYSK